MSEYIEIETESGDSPDEMIFLTNVKLAEAGPETYDSADAMEEGSPVAQALSYVEGIRRVHIEGSRLTVVREPDAAWHIIAADISAAIRDFFL